VAAGRICKAASSLERAALPQLMNDALKPFVPEYYEEVLIDGMLVRHVLRTSGFSY
jgi:hypothetical protein